VSEELGSAIYAEQIRAKQVRTTPVIQLTVENPNPRRAADIANILVKVLMEQNETMQAGRYTSTEESIRAQIAQIDEQIKSLQREVEQITTRDFQEQLSEVETQIRPLQEEVSTLQQEIAVLEPALTAERKAQVAEKQARIDQIQPLLNLYQQIYSNLVVLGKPVETDANISSRMVQLQSTLDLYQNLYLNLLSSLETIRLARLQNTPNIVQIEPAGVPETPIRPRPLMNTALATIVGLMLAAGLVFLIEYLDDTLKTPEDVERVLQVPVLGFVADIKYKGKSAEQVYVAQQPRSPVSEAFRSLRTNLDFAAVQSPIRTILVTSTGPGEGKTTVAVNLAAIFSQAEKRVALLDADMRRPSVHRLLEIPNREGLSTMFLNQAGTKTFKRRKEELPYLFVITSGSLPPNPAELLGSEKMNQLLDEIREQADVVVIDTPPSLVTDAQVLSAKVDAVLFVVQPGVTRVEAAKASLDMFKRAGARVVGVVMNRIPRNRSDYYGGYNYYSAYSNSKYYVAKEAATPSAEPVKKPLAIPTVNSVQNPVEPSPATIESPPARSYLAKLFEKVKEFPPADPKQMNLKK
jgi:polysaccharide biosynthesis transport protein